MLDPAEKAYCSALLALKRKEYEAASDYLDKAANRFAEDSEFNILRETTRLLLAVREELTGLRNEDTIEIEEAFAHGQETELR